MGDVGPFIACSVWSVRLWCQATESLTTQEPLCMDNELAAIVFAALFKLPPLWSTRVVCQR